jgi:hypothetical protein
MGTLTFKPSCRLTIAHAAFWSGSGGGGFGVDVRMVKSSPLPMGCATDLIRLVGNVE